MTHHHNSHIIFRQSTNSFPTTTTIYSNFIRKSFEGIEGTVDIATICGTTGPILKLNSPSRRDLQDGLIDQIKIGYIVQTIKVKSNMPLPVAP